jgi:hypothetical protein
MNGKYKGGGCGCGASKSLGFPQTGGQKIASMKKSSEESTVNTGFSNNGGIFKSKAKSVKIQNSSNNSGMMKPTKGKSMKRQNSSNNSGMMKPTKGRSMKGQNSSNGVSMEKSPNNSSAAAAAAASGAVGRRATRGRSMKAQNSSNGVSMEKSPNNSGMKKSARSRGMRKQEGEVMQKASRTVGGKKKMPMANTFMGGGDIISDALSAMSGTTTPEETPPCDSLAAHSLCLHPEGEAESATAKKGNIKVRCAHHLGDLLINILPGLSILL